MSIINLIQTRCASRTTLHVSRFTNDVFLLLLFLSAFSAWAGDLTVDNLTVSNNAAIQGKLDFYSITSSTNTNSVTATGGTITTNGNYRIHTFTNNGTFEISTGSITCDVLVVAGGGGGGAYCGGGGGGGGVIFTNMSVSGNNSVVVGAGGVGGADAYGTDSTSGSNSSFNTIVANGGGSGAGSIVYSARNGGSGGGARGGEYTVPGSGTSGQGHDGGDGYTAGMPYSGAGGGGGAADGADGTGGGGGDGGDGYESNISGTTYRYGGGGGGGTHDSSPAGNGGDSGGGDGGITQEDGSDGAANSGGGGGGGGNINGGPGDGGDGGSGIVIVRYSINQSSSSSSNITTLTISSNGISQTSADVNNVLMGKVGIGTDNPAEKLHVAGNLRVDGTSIVSAVTLGGVPITNWASVAAGVLMASNNLSDVENAETARSNLGLGSAATYDAGVFLTTNGNGASLTNITASQVGAVSTNDGVLLSANNLSDVANAGTARNNLGLGSAATNEANAFLSPTGNGSQLTGLTAAQAGALSTNGGEVNGVISFVSPAGDIPMGVYTNQ